MLAHLVGWRRCDLFRADSPRCGSLLGFRARVSVAAGLGWDARFAPARHLRAGLKDGRMFIFLPPGLRLDQDCVQVFAGQGGPVYGAGLGRAPRSFRRPSFIQYPYGNGLQADIRSGFLHAALIGAGVGLLAELGDLSESLIKRDCQVKDSGNLFPGFGRGAGYH